MIKEWVVIGGLLVSGFIFYIAFLKHKPDQKVITQESLPPFLYKVISMEGWLASQKSGRLSLGAIDTDFIHLSLPDQLERVCAKFWKDIPQYIILKVDPKKFVGTLKYEFNPGGSSKYYHLYDGYIPLEGVIEITIITEKKQ